MLFLSVVLWPFATLRSVPWTTWRPLTRLPTMYKRKGLVPCGALTTLLWCRHSRRSTPRQAVSLTTTGGNVDENALCAVATAFLSGLWKRIFLYDNIAATRCSSRSTGVESRRPRPLLRRRSFSRVPFDESFAWPGDDASLAHDVMCPGCREGAAAAVEPPLSGATFMSGVVQHLARADCVACKDRRLDRFQRLLDLCVRTLLAARQHARTKAKALLSWCGAEGKTRAQHMRDAPGLTWDEDGVADASALDRLVLTGEGGSSGSWARGATGSAALQATSTMLISSVTPQTSRSARRFGFSGSRRLWTGPWAWRLAPRPRRARTSSGRGNKELLDFVKRVLKTDGEWNGRYSMLQC